MTLARFFQDYLKSILFLQNLRKEIRNLGNWNKYQNCEQNPKAFFHFFNNAFLEIKVHLQMLS